MSPFEGFGSSLFVHNLRTVKPSLKGNFVELLTRVGQRSPLKKTFSYGYYKHISLGFTTRFTFWPSHPCLLNIPEFVNHFPPGNKSTILGTTNFSMFKKISLVFTGKFSQLLPCFLPMNTLGLRILENSPVDKNNTRSRPVLAVKNKTFRDFLRSTVRLN